MNPLKQPHIYISAGEASGDLLGAALATSLQRKNPLLQLTGMGGARMTQSGVDIKFDANKLSVVGLIEVLAHLPVILKTLRNIKRYLKNAKPDLIVLIDFPDTHLRIAKTAKQLGIPVLYYVSPQIWAWRASRIKQIKKNIDHIAILFAFEEKIYQDAGVPVTFVGHHLRDSVKPSMTKEVAFRFFGLNTNQPIVALLPGSRSGEIKRHLPLLIASAKLIQQKMPDIQFMLPLAAHLDETSIKAQLPKHIRLIKHHLYDLLQITNAAVAVSGTITLEIGLMQVPLCIVYRLNTLTYWVIKCLAKVSRIGLCNIVAEKVIAKEFVQRKATVENIAAETLKLLSDTAYSEQMKKDFMDLKESLGQGKASEQVAAIVLNMLSDKPAL